MKYFINTNDPEIESGEYIDDIDEIRRQDHIIGTGPFVHGGNDGYEG